MKKNDEWCDSQEIVPYDKKKRCSKCGRRLIPRETDDFDYHGIIYRLPPHKKNGKMIFEPKYNYFWIQERDILFKKFKL